ncbi:MAG: cation-translocating P-type ATPase [Planctomycetes bacterium]|nr:cation-translocating P-type ATPase [Planctomycetota bacterium]
MSVALPSARASLALGPLPCALALGVLALAPARPPGAPWLEGALCAAVILGARRGRPGPIARALLELRLDPGLPSTLAAALGFATSLLLAALDAAGRLPPALADPRGGPASLQAAAAAIAVLRSLSPEVGAPPPGGGAPDRDGGAQAPPALWVAAAAGLVLGGGWAAAHAAASGGAPALAAALMALLAASPLEALRGAAVERPIETVVLEAAALLDTERLEVLGVFPLGDRLRPEDLLQVAAAAEYRVAHPIRDALLRGHDSRARTVLPLSDIVHLPSRGIRARQEGQEVLLGNVRLFREAGWSDARLRELEARRADLSPRGETVLFLALGSELVGAICLEAPVRDGAARALGGLAGLGIAVEVLGGEETESLERVLSPLGPTRVRGGLLEPERAELVESLRASGRRVAVVRLRRERGDRAGGPPSFVLETGRGTSEPLGEDLAAAVEACASDRGRVRAQRARAIAAGLYQALAVPAAAGALEPWTGLGPSPILAAAAGALAPGLLRFVFSRAEAYNRRRSKESAARVHGREAH